MSSRESELIQRAAMVMKVLRLIAMPGMDMTAVKLNMQPTHDELLTATAWRAAFDQCGQEPQRKVLEIAEQLDISGRIRSVS